MEKFLKVLNRLLKFSATSLDSEHLFLCPLFIITFDKASLCVLFYSEAPYG